MRAFALAAFALASLPGLVPAASHPDWNTLLRGADGIYVTLWSASGVVACRGVRGRLDAPPEQELQRLLSDARAEAELHAAEGGAPKAIVRARVTSLRNARAVDPGSHFDPAREALRVGRGEQVAVILPGEARTAAYAWRKACRLLGLPETSVPRLRGAHILAASFVDIEGPELRRALRRSPA